MYDHPVISVYQSSFNKAKQILPGLIIHFMSGFWRMLQILVPLYNELYSGHPRGKEVFGQLIQTIIQGYKDRPAVLKERDGEKQQRNTGFYPINLQA